ncbi:MAG: hypothetical protein JWO30_3573 [Fibrobacteres bacterium]|nr:hypothetical protein [Fibrobacterota bacterium]
MRIAILLTLVPMLASADPAFAFPDRELRLPAQTAFATPETAPGQAAAAPLRWSRPASLGLESGLGLALGGAAAAIGFYSTVGSAQSLAGFGTSVGIAGVAGGLGSGIGVLLGGHAAGRRGSAAYTLMASLAGQALGGFAAMKLYESMDGATGDTPICVGVAFTIPTLLGALAYNLSGN